MVRCHAIKFWIQRSSLKANYSFLVANILRREALIWNSVFKYSRNQSSQVLQTKWVSVVRVAVLYNVLLAISVNPAVKETKEMEEQSSCSGPNVCKGKGFCGRSHRSLKVVLTAACCKLLNTGRYCTGDGREKAGSCAIASFCFRSRILTKIIHFK